MAATFSRFPPLLMEGLLEANALETLVCGVCPRVSIGASLGQQEQQGMRLQVELEPDNGGSGPG